jgi:predicted phosphodiesterase
MIFSVFPYQHNREKMTRIAILSDIHGNLPALEAVISDLQTRPIDMTVALGDLVSGPLWPAETADLLMRQTWIYVAGNHDRQWCAKTQPPSAPPMNWPML